LPITSAGTMASVVHMGCFDLDCWLCHKWPSSFQTDSFLSPLLTHTRRTCRPERALTNLHMATKDPSLTTKLVNDTHLPPSPPRTFLVQVLNHFCNMMRARTQDPRLNGVKIVYYSVSENFSFLDWGGGRLGVARKPKRNIRGSSVWELEVVAWVCSSTFQSSGGGDG
jgi:hypothetical protein